MSLRNIGYTEKRVQLRQLFLAELQLEIIKMYRAKGEKEVELIEVVSGEVSTYRNIDDVLNEKMEW